jgi:hypothetical protein
MHKDCDKEQPTSKPDSGTYQTAHLQTEHSLPARATSHSMLACVNCLTTEIRVNITPWQVFGPR